MPELPEVETVRRGLAPVMTGRRIAGVTQRRADLRFPLPADMPGRLEGARVLDVGRRAKYLVLETDHDLALIMHLGMTGRFTIGGTRLGEFVHETGADPRHEHVVFELDDGARIGFSDPRRFGFMDLWPSGELAAYPAFADLGPEPMAEAFGGRYLRAAFARKASPVKAALLDQSVVAGLGNIYVCEALFRAGVHPARAAGRIGPARLDRLAEEVRQVIAEAIAAGGSSISDFAAADGSLGYFQHTFRVYGREGEACPSCGGPIRRVVQSGRSSFFCGKCQK
jgi:formamidopyrimidine-DNA glycosylase